MTLRMLPCPATCSHRYDGRLQESFPQIAFDHSGAGAAVMNAEAGGGMLCFETPEGTTVHVDPRFVAYIEPHGPTARLVFSGGFDLLIRNDAQNAHERIGAGKQAGQP